MNYELVKSVASIIQAATGALIPPFIILAGRWVSRSLESTKVQLAQEKEWRTKWAEAFYLTSTQFMTSVGEFVCLMSEVAELDGKDDPHSSVHKKELTAAYTKEFRSLQRQEWNIQTQLHSAPRSAGEVQLPMDSVTKEVAQMVRGRGSFETIRDGMKQFQSACQKAYQEMLNC